MSLTLEELEDDPHPALARLRASEPVAWIPALDAWLVTSREHALLVMRDAETYTVDDPRFSTGQVVGPSMLTRDGVEHDRHRAPFAHSLRLAEVREHWTAVVEDETDALLDTFAGEGRTELRRSLAGPLAARVVARLLGLETSHTTAMLGWYDAIVASVHSITAGTGPTAAGAESFEALREAVAPALGSLDGLTPEEVVSNAAVMMFGGIETTDAMIVNLVYHLLSNGVRQVTPNAVEESLRLEPAASVVDRYATRDVELAGASIVRGDLVRVSLAGANRDPSFFPDPDRFDPERENARYHVTFAHGPHVCVGMHLARLEALTAARKLFEQLPDLQLAEPAAPRGLVFRKPTTLEVVWS